MNRINKCNALKTANLKMLRDKGYKKDKNVQENRVLAKMKNKMWREYRTMKTS